MKRKIGFVVDSTFGEAINDVTFVPLTIDVDGKDYIDGTIDNEIIVEALSNKKHIKTSQPSPDKFVLGYKEQFAKGYDYVICLTVASSLSGTFNSATLAKEIYDNDNVYVIDTKSVNIGSKYILEKAIEYAEANNSLEDVLKYIDELIARGSVIFSVDELGTLVRNGRLSRTSALIGNILRIKPILRFKEGVLEVEAKVRRFGGVLKYITGQVENMLEKLKVIVRITYVDNIDYANSMKEAINNLDNKNIDIKIMDILTPVVSAHVGLGGMGIYLTYE